MKARILNIDAWRDRENSWFWNNWFQVAECVELPDNVTNRQLLKLARDEFGLLSETSKGKVAVNDDGHNIVILAKGTRQPLYAFEYGCFIE